MKRRTVVSGLASIAAVAWLGLALPVHAEDDFVYGRELMTQQEMTEHRAHMRSLNTEQEREAYRLEHHKLMQERAREQGKTLPDAAAFGWSRHGAGWRRYGARRWRYGTGRWYGIRWRWPHGPALTKLM